MKDSDVFEAITKLAALRNSWRNVEAALFDADVGPHQFHRGKSRGYHYCATELEEVILWMKERAES